jgi:hypothetical protein
VKRSEYFEYFTLSLHMIPENREENNKFGFFLTRISRICGANGRRSKTLAKIGKRFPSRLRFAAKLPSGVPVCNKAAGQRSDLQQDCRAAPRFAAKLQGSTPICSKTAGQHSDLQQNCRAALRSAANINRNCKIFHNPIRIENIESALNNHQRKL